jgi:hypothetical protein
LAYLVGTAYLGREFFPTAPVLERCPKLKDPHEKAIGFFFFDAVAVVDAVVVIAVVDVEVEGIAADVVPVESDVDATPIGLPVASCT